MKGRQVGVAQIRRHADLELRPGAAPDRVLGDRLGGVGRQPVGALEVAGGPTRSRDEPHPDRRRLRGGRARDFVVAPSDEHPDGFHELAVGPHLFEHGLGNRDAELAFEHEGELDEVERVGGEVIGEGHFGGELVRTHPEMLRDEGTDLGLEVLRRLRPPRPGGTGDEVEHAANLGDVRRTPNGHRTLLSDS